jgi:hypothetical protein
MRTSGDYVKDSLMITNGYMCETWQALTVDASPAA